MDTTGKRYSILYSTVKTIYHIGILYVVVIMYEEALTTISEHPHEIHNDIWILIS